jgi:hypothetical protein
MKIYDPQVRVRLIKTIGRAASSFTPAGNPANGTAVTGNRKQLNIIDLSPFLGEGTSIKTKNSVRDISGTFSLVLNDRMDSTSKDSIYASIEPMDIIEISMSNTPYEYPTKKPPVIMRGFVSAVNRNTTIGQDGKPSRHVTVTGEDYGKLFKIFQIYYLNNAAMGEFHLTPFDFFKKYGTNGMTSLESVDQFLHAFLNRVINPYLRFFSYTDGIKTEGIPFVFTPLFSLTGTISPFRLMSFADVNLERMLEELLDIGPFNELFVEDQDDKTYLVARPAPLLKAAHNDVIQYVQTGAKADFIDIYGYDLQSISEGRSDRGIANFYWVQSAEWALIEDMNMKLQAQAPSSVDSMLKLDYPNCSLKRYNIRRMSVKKSMGPVGVISSTGNGTPEEKRQASLLGSDYFDKCRKILAESNKDNVVFESGSMRLRGNEKIKAGRYLRLKRGEKTASLYYAVSVEHEYVPYVGYSTTVNYERGTGFIDRISRETSPYLGENNLEGFA